MKKRILSVLLAAAMLISTMPAAFAESPSSPGEVLSGDYVAVVNTGTSQQSTGNLAFDDSTGVKAAAVESPESFGLLPGNDVLPDGGADNAFISKGKARAAGYTVGQTGTFYQDTAFVCIAVGKECYVWMEKSLYDRYGADNHDKAGKEIAAMYDGRPFEVISALSGGQDFYKDGTGKLSILVEELSGSSGFYAGEDKITAIHINAVAPDKYASGAYGKSDGLIVHETQHAMFRWLACGGDKGLAYKVSWINEGLSVAAMDYYWGGDDPTGWLTMINGNLAIRNGSSLLYDAYRNSSAQDYSMPDLFIRYLANQKEQGYNPLPMMKSFYNGGMNAAGGDPTAYVNSVLKKAGLKGEGGGDLTLGEALQNFYVAAVAQENTGKYGFYGDPIIRRVVTDYPIYAGTSGQAVRLEGSAAIILKTANGQFTVPSGAGANIRFVAFNKTTGAKLPLNGDGTPGNPYQITNLEDLGALSGASGASYKLMNSIDAAGAVLFPPSEFTGSFDGDGKTISNLTKPLVGTNRGTIRNLTVDGFSGEFKTWTGVLSNFNSGTISDCAVTGTVDVRFTSTKPFNLPSFGTMTAQNEYSGIITRCFTTADITVSMPENTDYVGMIAGENKYQISDCYAQGTLTVNGSGGGIGLSVGGIVGDQYSSMYPRPFLENSYSTTAITVNGGGASLKAGQAAGSVQADSTVTGCYGLSGSMSSAVGSGSSSGAALKTDAELKAQATFTGWSFGSIWKMQENGYPAFDTPDSITAALPKTTYFVGEALDFFNATLTAGTGKVPLTADMVRPFDSGTPGEKTVTGSYKGVAFRFSVTVKAPANVTFLEVYTKPKTAYVEGESFDPAGTRLRATADGTQNVYAASGYTVDKTSPLTPADTTVTYTYGNKTAELPITVGAKASQVQSVSVLSAPGRMSYYVGDQLALAGLKAQLIYKDGSKSAVFAFENFAANGLSVSLGMDAAAQNGDVLKDADNQKSLYVYLGSTLPKDPDSIYRAVGLLTVERTLWLDDQALDFTVNQEASYVSTDSIEGISSSGIQTTLKSGSLPNGLTVTLPSGINGYVFRFDGTPTATGSSEAVYTVKDKGSGREIDVKITLRVNPPSAACDLTKFSLRQALGSIPAYEGVIDHANKTVLVTVPDGFNRASASFELSKSTGAKAYFEGSSTEIGSDDDTDFSSGKGIKVVAEDGSASKVYQVTVTNASPGASKLGTPGNLSWNTGLASWDAVPDADGYVVNLYEYVTSSSPVYLDFLGGVNLTDTQHDFSSLMVKKADYRFSVTAYKAGSLDSDSVVSRIFSVTGSEVRGVTVSPTSAAVKVGGSAAFTATVEGLGAYNQAVAWTVTGGLSAGTKLVDGALSVGTDETADELTVRATSVQDGAKYAEAVVAVEPLTPLQTPQNLAWSGERGSWDAVPDAETYKVALLLNGTAVGTEQTVTTASFDFSSLIAGAGEGAFTFRVKAAASGSLDSQEAESPVYTKTSAVNALTIKTPPSKLTYYAGNSFVPDGLTVTVVYESGRTIDVTYGTDTSAQFQFSPATLTLGTTQVTVTYGGKTVNQAVTVQAKKVLTAGDFQMDQTQSTYNKTAQGVSVTPKAGVTGVGAVTVRYNGLTDKPTNAGAYAVTADVAEGEECAAVTGLAVGTYTINPIALDNPTVTLPPVKQHSLADNAEVSGAACAVASSKILTGDTVQVTGTAKYPSTKALGRFTDGTLTTAAVPDNQNYTLGAGTVLSNAAYEVTDKDLTGITVKAPPAKTAYYAGDTFDKTGLKVAASWEYGADTDVTGTAVILTDTPLKADSKVFVQYTAGDKTFQKEIPITVTPIVLERIEITGTPSKTTYSEGAAFEPAGITVKAYYNDSRKDGDVTGSCTFTPKRFAVGDTEVTVHFTGPDGRELTAVVQGITVKEKAIIRIAVGKAPAKTVYTVGEAFAPEGLELALTYDNGTTGTAAYSADSKDRFKFTPASLALDTKEVEITYNDFKVKQPVTVNPKAYAVIEGANGAWAPGGSNAGLTLRADVPLEQFIEVKVNGAVLDRKYYTVKSGSTIATLTTEYLATLPAGTYSLELVFTDGAAQTSFTVKAAAQSSSGSSSASQAPGSGSQPSSTASSRPASGVSSSSKTPTGDPGAAAPLAGLFLACSAALCYVAVRKKKD